jgi:hypothetical protein
MRTAPILLLSRSDIQKELSLSPELVVEARALAVVLQRKALALHGQTGSGLLVARRAIDDEQARWLNQKLSRPQLERLHQLDLQWEGPAALASRPIIADALDLTPEQRTAIAQAIADNVGLQKPDFQSRQVGAERSRRILEILSPQQRERWSVLQGIPFEFEADLRTSSTKINRKDQVSRR